jgi:hypothetical protein
VNDDLDFIEIGGERFACGLNLPSDGVRPMTFDPLPDSFLLTKSQIEKITTDPRRTPRRQLFAGRKWIWSQGSVGSCNGQSQAGAVMRARHFRNLSYVKLSGSGLYAFMNDGRDRGSGLEEGRLLIETKGVPIAEGLEDNRFYLQRNIPQSNVQSMARFRCQTYRVDNQDQLASGVAQDMMAVIAVTAGGKYSALDSNGIRGGGGGKGNHSVGCCDVFVRGGRYLFDEFGSWDLRNGQGGYAYLTWDRHLSGPNEFHSFFLIHTVIDDPNDPNAIKVK